MNVFEAVKGSLSTRQVAEYYGLKVNRNGMACCPFHNDRHPSMKVDDRYYCFGCGEKGDTVDFVSKYFGLGPKDAALKIYTDFGITAYESYHPRGKPHKVSWGKSDYLTFLEAEQHCIRVLCDYLHLLERWKTEYAPKDANESWHPYFTEALQNTVLVEYLLDTLLTGDVSDRAFIVSDYGRKVIEIEKRMGQLGSTD